jgi:hypothetical protein
VIETRQLDHELVSREGEVMRTSDRLAGVLGTALLAILLLPALADAQPSRSAPLAKQLAQMLEERKLDSVAAHVPNGDDRYVAALFFPNLQFLVVSARYSAPVFIEERLRSREYREVYIDLNSASIAGSKVFYEDLRADGFTAQPDGAPDSFEAEGKRIVFDGEPRKQKLSEREYADRFAEADAQYARMLELLIAELKKGS